MADPAASPLSEQEELELELEMARARQAQAKPPDPSAVPPPDLLGKGEITPAMLAASRARHDAMAKQQQEQQAKEGLWPQTVELGRSMGEGLAAIPDILPGIASKFTNVANALTGRPPLDPKVAAPLSSLYNEALPPNPTFPTTRQWGNAAGPAIVESLLPPLAGVMPEASLMRNVVRPAAETVSTVVGQDVGRGVGEAIGGDAGGDVGSQLGSIFAPFAPAIAKSSAQRLVNRNYADEGTPGRVQQADIAGVPLSMGLVGNKSAGVLEDATAGIPFGGGPAYAARRSQYEALDASVRDVANAQRGGPPTSEISKDAVGQQVRGAADTANATARAAQDAVYNPIKARAGADVPIDQTIQLDQMDTIRRGSQPFARPPVQQVLDDTNASRLDTQGPLGAKVVDPQLETQLQAQLARAQANLAAAQPGSALARAAQASINQTMDAIAANRGQTFQEVIDHRSRVGRRIEGQQPLDQAQTIDVKNAMTGSLERRAVATGTPAEDFQAANDEYGRIADQRGIFKKLRNEQKTTPDAAYNKLSNSDVLNALKEHVPDALAQIMANALELKARGRAAGAQIPDPESATPRQTSTWWNALSDTQKDLFAGPVGTATRDRMDATVSTMEADARRPTRTLPGAGGTTLGAPMTLFGSGAVLGGLGHILGGGGGSLTGLAAALGPTVAAQTIGRAFTDPRVVRGIVNPDAYLSVNDLSRLMAGAAGMRGTQ